MPRQSIPFVPQAYDYAPGSIRMSEIRRRTAADQADLALRQGDISANLGHQLAGIAGGVANAIGQYQADKPKRQAAEASAAKSKALDQALRESIDPNTGRIDFTTAAQRVTPIDPMAALELWDKSDQAQKQAVIKASEMAGDAAQKAGSLLLRYEKMSPPAAQAEYDQLRAWVVENKLPDAEQMPEQFSAPFLRKALMSVMTADQIRQQIMGSEKPPTTRQVEVKNPDGSTSIQIVEDKPGQTFNSAAPVKEPKQYPVTVAGPNGPMQRLASEQEMAAGVPVYREPKSAAQPSYQRIETVDEAGNPLIKFMTPEEVRAMGGIKTSPKTTAAAKGPATVTAILGEIEGLSKQINTSGGSPMANVTGKYRQGMAAGNMDNTVSEYNALVTGFIPMIARAVGHTGVLTQQDVDSVRALFPLATDNAALAASKLERVKRLMSAMTPSDGTAAAPAAPVNPFRKK